MNVQQYNRRYYELHKDVLIERSRLWREKNRDKLIIKVVCECGGRYLATNKTNHTRTQKHAMWVEFERKLKKELK
jgi:hypothetical protein